MKRRHCYFLAIALLPACQHLSNHGFKIEGNISGFAAQKVYLAATSFDNKPPRILDSAAVENGKFELKGIPGEEQVFRVLFGGTANSPYVDVINDVPEIQLSVDASQDGKYEVKNSPTSSRYQHLLDTLQGMQAYIMHVRDSLKTKGDTTTASQVVVNQTVGSFYDFLLHTANSETSPAIAAFALNFYSLGGDEEMAASYGLNLPGFDGNAALPVLENTQKKFGDNASFQQVVPVVKKMLSVPKVGSMAPELALPDTSDHMISLSSFRGKYVLVDFWASWCVPCRGENPNVVKAWQQFKDKNFVLIGVSLDKKKDAWLKAIKDDGLVWTQLSDLKFWDSKAVEVFQFNGIPYNVLIDPQGKIIGSSLRGEGLIAKLKEVLP